MKIKFDLDDKLPLNKTVEIPIATIVVRAVFNENKKNYPQVFSMNICYITIELMFLKELMLI